MATESKESKNPDAGQDPVEAFTDDLIREFFTEAGQSAKSAGLGSGAMAALLEAAMGSPSRRAWGTSILERVLLAQAIASELADVLAPALAADGAVAPEGTPPSPETSTAVPEQGGGQGAPEASAPPDLSKTEVGKPGMGCCTMLPNGAVMCRC